MSDTISTFFCRIIEGISHVCSVFTMSLRMVVSTRKVQHNAAGERAFLKSSFNWREKGLTSAN